jgi:DNA-binding MarR family transcriptional regulator
MATRPKLKVLSSKPEALPTGYELDEQIGFRLRIATQRHTSIFAEKMIEGLTPTQFAALAKLLEVGPCSQNHLGRLIYLDASTIKGVVDRLKARNLLTTSDDSSDRRRRAIALTDKGRRAAEAATKVAAQITAKTLAPLTTEEQRAIVRILKKLG